MHGTRHSRDGVAELRIGRHSPALAYHAQVLIRCSELARTFTLHRATPGSLATKALTSIEGHVFEPINYQRARIGRCNARSLSNPRAPCCRFCHVLHLPKHTTLAGAAWATACHHAWLLRPEACKSGSLVAVPYKFASEMAPYQVVLHMRRHTPCLLSEACHSGLHHACLQAVLQWPHIQKCLLRASSTAACAHNVALAALLCSAIAPCCTSTLSAWTIHVIHTREVAWWLSGSKGHRPFHLKVVSRNTGQVFENGLIMDDWQIQAKNDIYICFLLQILVASGST